MERMNVFGQMALSNWIAVCWLERFYHDLLSSFLQMMIGAHGNGLSNAGEHMDSTMQ